MYITKYSAVKSLGKPLWSLAPKNVCCILHLLVMLDNDYAERSHEKVTIAKQSFTTSRFCLLKEKKKKKDGL